METLEIPLTQGKVALIDPRDCGLVSRYKWYAHRYGHHFYAETMGRHYGVRKQIRMHRFIIKAARGVYVDHINGNGLDNRRCNLRLCTFAQNSYNQKSVPGSSSAYRGVSWHSTRKHWRSQIVVNGLVYTIASTQDETLAALLYDVAATASFGTFARLNFPE